MSNLGNHTVTMLANTYTSPEYEPTGAMKYFDSVPRFGHPEMISFQEGDVKDYVLGLLFIPGCICSITIVWFALLAIFMCSYRTSFLSGRKLHYRDGVNIRIFFLLSASIVLISSIIFLTIGIGSFLDTFDDFVESKNDLFKVIHDVVDVLRSIIRTIVYRITQGNQKLQEKIDEGVDYLPEEIANLLNSISENIGLSDYTDQVNQLEDYEESFNKALNETQADVVDFFEQVETVVGLLKYAMIPSIVTSSILGLAGVLVWSGSLKSRVYFLLQSYFILPVFVFLKIISGIIIALLGTVLVIFSDFCMRGEDRSPEGFLEEILDDHLHDEGARKLFNYYIINGCRTPNPFGGLVETINAVKDVSEGINDVIGGFSNVMEDRYEEAEVLNGLLGKADSGLTDLNYALQKGLDLTGCENINSLYIDAMHGGMCGSLPNAVSWVYWCLFVTWLGGLFMLATRSAIQPNCYQNSQELSAKDFSETPNGALTLNLDRYRNNEKLSAKDFSETPRGTLTLNLSQYRKNEKISDPEVSAKDFSEMPRGTLTLNLSQYQKNEKLSAKDFSENPEVKANDEYRE